MSHLWNTAREVVFTSPALVANDLIAIAANGLASAVDIAPKIEGRIKSARGPIRFG
jgi:hypothetical protein